MTTDEKLAEVSIPACHLFTMTLMFVDDAGRMEYSAKRLKMQVFPDRDVDIVPLVSELSVQGLFFLYEVNGKKYLCIPKFLKHQKIHKPTPSTYPPPFECSTINTREKPAEREINREEAGETVQAVKIPEVLEGEVVIGSGIGSGRGSGFEPAPDISAFQLARGLAENVGIPFARSNLEAIAHSIEAEAKNRGGLGAACDWLQDWALAAKARGDKVDKFAFEDARYNQNGQSSKTERLDRSNLGAVIANRARSDRSSAPVREATDSTRDSGLGRDPEKPPG